MGEKLKYESIDEFYSGKSVFVTGATGLIGKVCIEKLIYSCPKIQNIYILIRRKKTDDVAKRMQNLLDSPVFTRIKNERPKDLDKIIPLAGDLFAPDLGLHIDNEDVLIKEVSVVFHCAATVKFNEPLKTALAVNVEGTQKILNLCHRLKKLEVLVHVSTIYSNCNQKVIDEIIYPSPMGLPEVYDFVEYHDNDISQSASVLCGRPNTYTFTKALAESLIAQQLGNFRSVIISDNSHKRGIVLNICSSSVNPIRMQEIATLYSKEVVKNGFNDLPFPGVLMTERKVIVQSIVAVTMVIGYIADMLQRIARKRPRYVKLLEQLNSMRDSLAYFTCRSWLFKCENSRFLYNSLDEKDRQEFPCDPKYIDWNLYIPIYVKGVEQYLTKKKI